MKKNLGAALRRLTLEGPTDDDRFERVQHERQALGTRRVWCVSQPAEQHGVARPLEGAQLLPSPLEAAHRAFECAAKRASTALRRKWPSTKGVTAQSAGCWAAFASGGPQRRDFEAQQGSGLTIAPPGKCLFYKENECVVCLGSSLGSEARVI